jgi:hypothetical protein
MGCYSVAFSAARWAVAEIFSSTNFRIGHVNVSRLPIPALGLGYMLDW